MSLIFLDISDMLFYLGHHRNVSGIQRTQSNLVRSICFAGQGFEDVQFLSLKEDRSWYRLLDKTALAELVSALPDMGISHDAIRVLIASIIASGSEPAIRPNDMYIVTGAFWIYEDVYRLYNRLKDMEVFTGCYVYDLIPINQPDFCTNDLTVSFTRAFNRASYFFDFIMTISDHTRREVDAYILSAELPATVTATVRLAHTMNDHPPESSGFDLGGLAFNDFVLCVGTIEARKNHQLLYQVWKLLAEAGVTPMPKLVVVGRWGWRVEDLRSQIVSTNNLDGSIVILPDVDDETLELLYRECKFTIFPSFVEGWGMPVGESLVHGRFCLASQSSSIPEVGGRFVEYIDPYNARDAFKIVRRYLGSPDLLSQREALIRTQFVARTWDEFRDDFISSAIRCGGEVSSGRKPPVYPVIGFDDLIDASNQSGARSASVSSNTIDIGLAFVDGWDVPESLGRWMRSRTARLAFRLDARVGSCVIEFCLFSVPWASDNTIHISSLAGRVSQVVPPGTRFDVKLDIDSGKMKANKIILDFSLTGDYNYNFDPRNLCVGISSLIIKPYDNKSDGNITR